MRETLSSEDKELETPQLLPSPAVATMLFPNLDTISSEEDLNQEIPSNSMITVEKTATLPKKGNENMGWMNFDDVQDDPLVVEDYGVMYPRRLFI